jgi:hypothetical protein
LGVTGRPDGELDEERGLAYVGRYALELECLEARPAKESRVLRREAAEELGNVLIRVFSAKRLLLRRSDLRDSVLADRLVRWPVLFLAFRGLDMRSRSVIARHHGDLKNDSRSNLWSSA